jgi:16S rRNA (adenine1518-N6/adenine1519-N6)-dimethyltransferase
MPERKRVNAATSASGPRQRPKLGQNFLADPQAARRIVDALGDLAQTIVLEIGPGRGILTGVLAKRAARLIAIEIDRVLAAQLRMKYNAWPNVEIIEADVLAVDLAALLRPRPGALTGLAPQPPQKMRVIGNLPYYITSEILLRLFQYHEHFDSIVILVQKEVADRIAAKPGSSEYGLLSATAQLYSNVEKLLVLPPEAFAPPPKVHSALLRLTVAPRFQRLRVPEDGFIEFLKISFAQKRKTLLNNLKSNWELPAIRAALQKAKVAPDVRAEAVSLEQAAAVFRVLTLADQ